MQNVKKINYIESCWSYIFFLFFTIQILSPSVNDKTIYFDIIVALINPCFWKWFLRHSFEEKHLIFFLGLIIIMCTGHFMTSIKIGMVFFEVLYLFYLWNRELWNLKFCLFISVFFGIIQIIFLFIDPQVSMMLGPSNISQLIWGDYATAANSNFYAIFEDGLPRVSGLSRESGFMASLMISAIFLQYLTNKKIGKKFSVGEKFFFALGYIVSFSKMSLVIFLAYILNRIKGLVNLLPIWLFIFVWLIGMMFFWSWNESFLLDFANDSFLHRFGAYVSIADLDCWQILFGADNLGVVEGYPAQLMMQSIDFFAGFGGWIISNGIVVMITYFTMLYFLNVSTMGFLLLLLLTLNVQLDTNQNFVVLTYFLVFKYYRYESFDRLRIIKNTIWPKG